jgi:glutathione reductase (NADPH)
MVNASAYPKAIQDAAAYGWDVQAGAFDWPKFRGLLGAELTRLENAYRGTLKNAGVVVHDARATLADAHTVRLSTGETFSAKHILVATGGWPFVPDVPGAELGVTSNEMFDLESLPRRAAIVGGGYIASEFACILNGFGTQVTQYYRGPQILRGFDDEARGHVVAGMQAAGIDIRTNADVARLDRSAGGILVTDLTGVQIEVDLVLYATGRRPNVQGLGLEALGVAFGQQGEVIVDEWSQTSVASIYAVGDVTNRINLTPVAIREGHALADTLFRAQPTKADHALVASAVFTQPELGAVGLTE